MRFQVDEEKKEIMFLTASFPIDEIGKYLDKLEPLYPDVRKWAITIGVAIDTTPEKPEFPDFNFDKNTLPDGENK